MDGRKRIADQPIMGDLVRGMRDYVNSPVVEIKETSKKSKFFFYLLLPAMIAIIASTIFVSVANADNDIEWTWTPATEVTSIEDADFVYATPGICWGITWNGPADWTVEVITGEYEVERVINTVDFSPIIGCSAR